MENRRTPKNERETIILTTEADDSWEIYTFNTIQKKKLKQKALEYPELYQRIEADEELGYVRYKVHKPCFSPHFLSPQSDDRRKAASEYAKEHGFQAQQQVEDND